MDPVNVNETPLKHTANNYTVFTANRGDLRSGVQIEKPPGITEVQFIQDVAEFAAWHQHCIWPRLNGFGGYGSIEYFVHQAGPVPRDTARGRQHWDS